jgi:hypothetical protein
MLTTERAHYTSVWTHADGSPGRVDPKTPLEFEFDPLGWGEVTDLETHDDGRTPTSTTTTGYVSALEPAVAAAVDCVGDADFGEGVIPVRLRATTTVETPEEQVTAGAFLLETPTPKPPAA